MRCLTTLVFAVITASLCTGTLAASCSIVVGAKAPEMEIYAARELQRYLYQISGELPAMLTGGVPSGGPCFVVGRAETNPLLAKLLKTGLVHVGPSDPGPQGYVLKKLTYQGRPMLVVAGSDSEGVLYGVYGLLDEHYGIGFYMGGDVLPKRKPLAIPNLDERRAPQATIRGFLPWTNFPQSATVYSWDDWRFVIDQMAKMRMNFLHIHNYSGSGGHNEMFANFRHNGYLSRVWMATARSGHGWAGPKWAPSEYLFGAADLFDDYDFGADCALHNENLSNEEVFAKGVSLFQKVIEYAHSRGVRVGLGLDINQIPQDYNAEPNAPGIPESRAEQVATDYPDLDYLICFQYEGHRTPETAAVWRGIFDRFYSVMKQRSPRTRLAVAGWGIHGEDVATLPADVICAPISPYSASFEPGSTYGSREYWACPWLERDFRSSEYYYPYDMHLSDTIKAWQARTPNTRGLYCLTWRLTDAVDAKMSYIAKAPWDNAGKYSSSRSVYHEYAVRNYGAKAAEPVTDIINQNEPFASGFGECMGTPRFTGTFSVGDSKWLVNISRFRFRTLEEGEGPAEPWKPAAERSAAHGTQNAECSEGGECVGYIESGNWLRFDDFDFGSGATALDVRLAAPESGGYVQVRLGDQASGELLARIPIRATGGWQSWKTVTVPIRRVSGKHKLFFVFLGEEVNDLPKAEAQLVTLAKCIAETTDPGDRFRLELLRRRIAAERDHIWLNRYFPELPWEKLPGRFDSWARNFTHRVTDISSLGNVQSTQNRFIQLNYLSRENELRNAMPVEAPPSRVEARGTATGAIITWRNDGEANGFNVYRNGRKINRERLPYDAARFVDRFSGRASYAVSAETTTASAGDDGEGPPSVPSVCEAGSADRTPPHIVVVSPPTSVRAGQPLSVKARVLDGRAYECVSAVLHYRAPGEKSWHSLPMPRRVRSVFVREIPSGAISSAGIEFYVAASDGVNHATFPAGGRARPLSAVVTGKPSKAPASPTALTATVIDGKLTLEWKPASGAWWYRIYRGREPDFAPGPDTFVTYVDKQTTRFVPNGFDFDGLQLKGVRYYRVSALDRWDNESPPAPAVRASL